MSGLGLDLWVSGLNSWHAEIMLTLHRYETICQMVWIADVLCTEVKNVGVLFILLTPLQRTRFGASLPVLFQILTSISESQSVIETKSAVAFCSALSGISSIFSVAGTTHYKSQTTFCTVGTLILLNLQCNNRLQKQSSRLSHGKYCQSYTVCSA